MKIHDLEQGSDEWLELRGKFRCASESPVIMGVSKNMTRDDFIASLATMTPIDFGRYVEEVIFPNGHAVEAMARPIATEILIDAGVIGLFDDLWPIIGTNGKFLSSFDGLNHPLCTVAMEHKQWNEKLAESVRNKIVPDSHWPQLEHQFETCDTLERIMFVVSDGTAEKMVWCWYESVPENRAKLLKHWDLFENDVANYVPVEKIDQPKGIVPVQFPIPIVEVSGQLMITDNLQEFKEQSRIMIEAINMDLQTDQDFADAAEMVKNLKEAGDRINLIKIEIAKKADIDTTNKVLDDIKVNMMDRTRIDLEKLVDKRKTERKAEIVASGNKLVADFMLTTNKEFLPDGVAIADPDYNFFATIKGKRSYDNMISDINNEIANIKLDVNDVAAKVRANLQILKTECFEHEFLFKNKQELVYKDTEFLILHVRDIIKQYDDEQAEIEESRVAKHKAVMENIRAAGEVCTEDTPIFDLKSTIERLEGIDTSKLEEYEVPAQELISQSIAKIRKFIATGEVNAEPKKQESSPEVVDTVSRSGSGGSISAPAKTVVDGDDALPGADDLDDGYGDVLIHTGSQDTDSNDSEVVLKLIVKRSGEETILVEIEDCNGKSISIGSEVQLDDGLSEIVITSADLAGI